MVHPCPPVSALTDLGRLVSAPLLAPAPGRSLSSDHPVILAPPSQQPSSTTGQGPRVMIHPKPPARGHMEKHLDTWHVLSNTGHNTTTQIL